MSKTQNKVPQENIFGVFLVDILTTKFCMENLTQNEHNLGTFNICYPKYPWKWLNELFWLYQGSEYTWLSYMFVRLLKMLLVLNLSVSWIWHGYICRGYTEFWICLNMAQYASIMPEYALMSLNMSEHGILLNVPEFAWKYLMILDIWQGLEYTSDIKYFSILNMPWYSYNNLITIVTNVIILELFSVWFVPLGAAQLSILSFLTKIIA